MAQQQAKMPRGKIPKGVRLPNQKLEGKTVKRLLGYLLKHKVTIVVVAVCIILSSLTNVASSVFLQLLIDNYITPALGSASPVLTGMAKLIITMIGIFVVGIVSSYLYMRLMGVMSQKILKEIRDEMFEKMQKLPIKYFDTHSHGDIMSHYTNDADTLRQMLSQSLPQMFSSIITLAAIIITMIITSWQLTLVVAVFLALMLFAVKKVTGRSGKYFMAQQESIGNVNGYIEELINGQKVVKVFNH